MKIIWNRIYTTHPCVVPYLNDFTFVIGVILIQIEGQRPPSQPHAARGWEQSWNPTYPRPAPPPPKKIYHFFCTFGSRPYIQDLNFREQGNLHVQQHTFILSCPSPPKNSCQYQIWILVIALRIRSTGYRFSNDNIRFFFLFFFLLYFLKTSIYIIKYIYTTYNTTKYYMQS